jgi:hypothetical protein
MKQRLLPGFPEGAQRVGEMVSVLKKDGQVTYFIGDDNYFSHPEGDLKSQRFALASLMINGHVRAVDLEKEPLCIPHRTLMHWKRRHVEEGPASFYRETPPHKPRIMTPEKIAECSQWLGEGHCIAATARHAGIDESTLRKAVARQVVIQPERTGEAAAPVPANTKALRSRADAEAASALGTACTRADERTAAAMGLAVSATTRFEAGADVSLGGLLAGLPALCANGLLSGIGKHLHLPRGFYSTLHILLTLGFMALARIRRPEGLRHQPPGELGKVVGLDRVPEVRTLREKITTLAHDGDPRAWMRELSATWMADDPTEAGYLYVDGHVRVYHGDQATLPRRFVSRERLCLRGTTDYWINDAIGRPFFVISKAVTDGLAATLIQDIVPDLLKTVPSQPSPEDLEHDPGLHRFILVFDREGATASLFCALWEQRIGAITYRKNVKDAWPEEAFTEVAVTLPGGACTTMKLAERDTLLSGNGKTIPVKEVRRLTGTGHQSAVISSARGLDAVTIAARMFSRWCQENFFAYMMQHYDIDGLIEYGAEALPGTLEVVNPAWRHLDKTVAAARRQLRKLQAKLGAEGQDEAAELQRKADCLIEVEAAEQALSRLRAERKGTLRKVTLDSLPEDQQPTQLLPLNKVLTDAVKMIAYRAETALVAILRRHLKKEEEARALIRELFVSSADIEPDDQAKTLTVRIHRMASPVHDRAIAALLDELNQLEFHHPETGARMIYSLV